MRKVIEEGKVRSETESVFAGFVALVRCRIGRTCSSMWYIETVGMVKGTAVVEWRFGKVRMLVIQM